MTTRILIVANDTLARVGLATLLDSQGGCVVTDPIRRAAYDRMDREAILRRFPNLVAHLICESLGYATPTHAAAILKNAIVGDPDYCEWIDACWKCNPSGPVRRAIDGRHHHRGYMAESKHAKLLVNHYLAEHGEPVRSGVSMIALCQKRQFLQFLVCFFCQPSIPQHSTDRPRHSLRVPMLEDIPTH